MGRKLGATPCFGKAAKPPIVVVRRLCAVHTSPAKAATVSTIDKDTKKPGLTGPGLSSNENETIRRPA